MPRHLDEEGFDKVAEAVLEPFFRLKGQDPHPSLLPQESLSLLDNLEDFEIPGERILKSKLLAGRRLYLESLIQDEDRIRKKGRLLLFDLKGTRRLPLPDTRLSARVEQSFALEFRSASERFADGAVSERFQVAVKSLKKKAGSFDPSTVLAAGVLPQRKKLLGVETPVRVELLGVPISLRFLLALFSASKVRLFAAGPVLQEITF